MAARKPRGHEATRSLEKTSNSFAFASLDLRSSVPPYHHTPWGLSSWQSDRSTLTASSGYGDRSTWRALTAYFTAMAPSCHSPQGFQAWAWPAHPYNSFLAYETRPRLLPGSCPTPLLGQGDWRRCVCVCVCTQDIFQRLKGPSFEVQVGLHELLGHGSGKFLRENKDGHLNFDDGKVVNPLTNSKVTSWYKDKQTFDTQFSEISSSYEECRAECVGIFLCLNRDVLSIFGHEGERADDVAYVNWLSMVRAGLLGLEFYSPETNKWRQAHMQARYVILRVLQEVEGLVNISETVGEDGKPDLLITLDRSRVESEGKGAIGQFLLKLQVYMSTADSTAARAMYGQYSAVDEYFLKLREIVLARKVPRRMFVQPHTACNGNTVELMEFESSSAGIVQSFAARFPEYCADVQALWEADKKHWQTS